MITVACLCSLTSGADRPKPSPGVALNVYTIGKHLSRIPTLEEGQAPNVSRVAKVLDFDEERGDFGAKNYVAAVIEGYFAIPSNGRYQFRLTGDDGFRLSIGGELVIDADGLRAGETQEGVVKLKRGLAPFRIDYFENTGSAYLKAEWRTPRMRDFAPIPEQQLFHDATSIVPTEPGNKRIAVNKLAVDDDLAREEKVLRAIDAGIDALLGAISREQAAASTAKNDVGQVAFETYALLAVGVDSQHELIRKNFEYIREHIYNESNTYAVSSYLMALDAAIAQREYDAAIVNPKQAEKQIRSGRLIGEYKKPLKHATDALLRGERPKGGWRYVPTATDVDASCTQFAALALGVAARRGQKIDNGVWQRLADYFIENQEGGGPRVELVVVPEVSQDGLARVDLDEEDESDSKGQRRKKGRSGTGVRDPQAPLLPPEALEVEARGFMYMPERDATWSMTCAGVSTLILVDRQIGRQQSQKQRAALRKSLHGGLAWLQHYWAPTSDHYYGMYSVEKVGDLGAIAKVGRHDWYDELARHLIGEQEQDGFWPGTSHHGENLRVTTSFALLVLGRASSILTRKNPAEQVIVTGGGGGDEGAAAAGDENEHDWVYLRDMDRRVYVPGIIRALRQRPKPEFIELMRSICDALPPDVAPEMIPPLVSVRSRLEGRALKKALGDCLSSLSGEKLKRDEDFLERFKVWEEIRKLGALGEVERAPELLTLRKKHHKNAVLLKAALRALGQLRYEAATPKLIEDLEDSRKAVRASAFAALRWIHVSVPLFEPDASPTTRAAQVAEIRSALSSK